MSTEEPQSPERTTADYVIEAFVANRVHSNKATRWCWRAAFSLIAGTVAEQAALSTPWPWYPLTWAAAIVFGIDCVVGLTAVALVTIAVFLGRSRP